MNKILLEYSISQGCFHYNIDNIALKTGRGKDSEDWKPLGITTYNDADRFSGHIYQLLRAKAQEFASATLS